MKKVLVTGASGFIGHHLIERLLRDGYSVRALVRHATQQLEWQQRVELAVGDVQDAEAMRAATSGCDTVFHLAGKVHAPSGWREQEVLYHAVNVEGTRHVLEGAVAGGVRRLIFFSSTKAMGEETATRLDETCPAHPLTAYGRSKLAAERLVLEYGQHKGLATVCLRLPLVYGVGNKGNLFRMLVAIDRGVFPPLPPLGNRRSIVHVLNVVEAAILAATHPAASGQSYIVTDAEVYATRDLYDMICQELGRRIPHWYMPLGVLRGVGYIADVIGYMWGKRCPFDSDALEKLIGSAWYSADKIARELGYRPLMTFQDTLPELIAWYRKA